MRFLLKLLFIAVVLWALVFHFVGTGHTQPTTASTTIKHVVMILEENHSANLITASSMPYLHGLTGVTLSNDKNIAHPSLPNYFALTEGTLGGVTNDCGTSTAGCMQSGDNIYHQADTAGKGWRQLSESMVGNCENHNSSPYVVHHAPAPFYNDLVSTDCKTNDVPLNKSSVPAITAGFTFITPNNLDNGHSASLGAADNWLKAVVPHVVGPNTLVEITFDESGGGGNSLVYTKFIGPGLTSRVITTATNHYSLLRLNEELLGLPLLHNAATASDIRPQLGGL